MIEIFKREKNIKLSKYFELVKPQYIYLKITPDKSIRNYNTGNIIKAVSYTYKSILKRVRIEQKKLWIETSFKISYIVDIKNNDVKFYFQIPEVFKNVIMEKIIESWPKATIESTDHPEAFSKNAISYQLSYKNEDALSLEINKKNNEPLNSLLNVMEIMQDDDRVTIIYNFLPKSQFGWAKQYEDTIENFKNRKSVLRKKASVEYISKNIFMNIIGLIDSILDGIGDFIGSERKEEDSLSRALANILLTSTEPSEATKKKKEARIIDVQIAVVADGIDNTRNDNNATSVCQSFRVLDEDNSLEYRKCEVIPEFEQYQFNKMDINTISVDEAQNFIQIPGRNLLRHFKIKHIEVSENPIPERLQTGYFSLGQATVKGVNYECFLEDEYNVGSLPLVALGPQGSGKSSLIANMFKYMHSRKEGALLIDFIKNCELSDSICSIIPPEDRVVLDLSKQEDLQGFGYNELKITDEMSAYDSLRIANLKAQQTLGLIDSINVDEPLTSNMRTILSSASNVVFSGGYTSIRDVVNCLQDHTKRCMYISKLDDEKKEMLTDEILLLQSLNEVNKNGEIIGTRTSKIEYILSRINLLKEDFKLKYMFNKSTKNNIDLFELMEEGKIVIIKMPQSEFPSKMVKNVMVTYWLTKIWAVTEIRGKMYSQPHRTHLVVDEIFQAPTSMKLLEFNLPQSRKYGLKTILSTQYLRQIEPIFDTLEGSTSSFMMLKGTLEEDFKKLSVNITDLEYEDLRDMQKFYSLNLIQHNDGYSSFITKLPKPVTIKKEGDSK